MLKDLSNIKSGKKELRDFGLTIGIFLIAIGAVALFRGKGIAYYYMGIGTAFIVLGLFASTLLMPLQKAWMTLAVLLGFVMNRVVLTLLFYGVITPIGVILNVLGKDVLDQRIDKTKPSYWIAVDTSSKPKKSYENQF